jgi:hypothetical protein
MNATITVRTNRIYFERFEAPCGEPEVSEIKRAWESAIYKVIEDAGFEAEVEIGVGYDPAVKHYVNIEAGDECDCDNETPDCDCEAKAEIKPLVALAERYGERVAEQAAEAGFEAAAEKSGEFVRASEGPEI